MLLGLAPLSHLEFFSSTAVGELPHACIFSFLGSAMKLTGTFSFESPPTESAADTALLAVDGLLAACSVLICFAQAYRWLEDAVCLFDAGANVNSVHAPAAAPAPTLSAAFVSHGHGHSRAIAIASTASAAAAAGGCNCPRADDAVVAIGGPIATQPQA